MSTVIATARARLIDRHRLGSHSAEPTNTQIDNWLRDAFKMLIAAVPPIQKSSVTLDAQYSASLPSGCVLVQFAAYRNRLLQPTEWEEIGDYLNVGRGSAPAGGVVGLWYQKDYAIDDATTEVDTTDIFAQDRLEEAALVLASMQILRRLGTSSASRGGGKHAQMERVEQQERDTLVAMLRQQPDAWVQRRMQKLQTQLALGITPPSDNRLRGLINLGRMPSTLTGDMT